MKTRKLKKRGKGKTHRLSWVSIVLAGVLVVAGAITVVSRQLVGRHNVDASAKSTAADQGKKYVTVKVAGREVQVDPQTGQIKPLTPAEAKQLADGLKTMLNKSTDGLVPERRADGSTAMDLQGRFQNVVIARVNADGSLEESCVDEPLQAAQFFGIDPQLLGVQRTSNLSGQGVIRTPAKRVSR